MKAMVLRVCAADGSSYGGFKWPLTVGAEVVAPDWKDNRECGNGLHGWLFGQGDLSCADYWQHEGAQWLVVEVDSDSLIELGGKVKFPRGVVRFAGDKKSATDYLWQNEPRSRDVAVIGAQRADLRDHAMVQVGALGTATAGYMGTATAGEGGVISIEYYDGQRSRRLIGAIGKDGLKPNTPYRVESGKFVEAK